MTSIGISDFRANMNVVLQRVQQGEIVILTSRGSEVARIVPPNYARLAARQELARLRESAHVGDAVAPIGDTWEADA